MMKRLCRSRFLLAAALPLCGCAELVPPRSDAPTARPRDEVTHVIDYSEWIMTNGSEFRDRNADGSVDWEVVGADHGTDGYGIYKADNDFDGYYDQEYEAGGIAYHVNYTKPIHERVPQMFRPPTKTHWKPKAAPAGQSLTGPSLRAPWRRV